MMRLFFVTFVLAFSCSTLKSELSIPPNETFILGEENRKNYSASVSEVRCSADLKMATVYVLPFNHVDPQELTSFLGKNKSAIRHALGKELSLKYLPDLRFKEDTLFKQIEKTNQIFRALEKE